MLTHECCCVPCLCYRPSLHPVSVSIVANTACWHTNVVVFLPLLSALTSSCLRTGCVPHVQAAGKGRQGRCDTSQQIWRRTGKHQHCKPLIWWMAIFPSGLFCLSCECVRLCLSFCLRYCDIERHIRRQRETDRQTERQGQRETKKDRPKQTLTTSLRIDRPWQT